MPLEFTATDKGQIEAVAGLLQECFRVPSNAPFLNRSLLMWKYYQSGPPREGSRSYVLSDNGRFLAHAAIWPIQLRLKGGIRSGIGFSDWVATEEQRGIGLILLKKLATLAPFILVIGGAEITQQILPRVGFKKWADLPSYARVLRPLRQSRTRNSRLDWKEPLRVVRNFSWSLSPLASVQSWTAKQAMPDDQTLSLLNGQTGTVHTKAFLEFMLTCPAVPMRYVSLQKNGLPQGYAVLSVVGGQGRIVNIRIASEQESDWAAAVAAIVTLFKRDKTVCEVSSLASTPRLEKALQANGFRLRQRLPLVVLDTQNDMTREPVPQIGMLEDDASFLHNPESPYLT